MVRMCRTCHRPVQKISGKAKPCQRGIKLSFLLEFQVESLRCQSRRDMERCQKWKRLDKRNHTIVSQHHISFSTVFWQAVRANPPFTTGARNNKARLTALVEKDQSAQSIDPAACLKHAQTASHFASIYIDWSIIALEVWKYLEFSLRFEHVQKHSKTFFFCFTCFPFHDFMTSWLHDFVFSIGCWLEARGGGFGWSLEVGWKSFGFPRALGIGFLTDHVDPRTSRGEYQWQDLHPSFLQHAFGWNLDEETSWNLEMKRVCVFLIRKVHHFCKLRKALKERLELGGRLAACFQSKVYIHGEAIFSEGRRAEGPLIWGQKYSERISLVEL